LMELAWSSSGKSESKEVKLFHFLKGGNINSVTFITPPSDPPPHVFLI
jgi:hypothetical protein